MTGVVDIKSPPATPIHNTKTTHPRNNQPGRVLLIINNLECQFLITREQTIQFYDKHQEKREEGEITI